MPSRPRVRRPPVEGGNYTRREGHVRHKEVTHASCRLVYPQAPLEPARDDIDAKYGDCLVCEAILE